MISIVLCPTESERVSSGGIWQSWHRETLSLQSSRWKTGTWARRGPRYRRPLCRWPCPGTRDGACRGRPGRHREGGRRRAQTAAGRHPPARPRLAPQVPGDRAQLRRPHRRDGHGGAGSAGLLQQAGDLRDRARSRGAHAEGLDPARLRGRAGDGDRRALPPRPGRARPRGDRRLHLRQRRQRARLAGTGADDDDRQVLRHPRAARSLAGHTRRGRRPSGSARALLRQRRAAPGRQHAPRWSSTASSRSPTSPKPSPSSPAT